MSTGTGYFDLKKNRENNVNNNNDYRSKSFYEQGKRFYEAAWFVGERKDRFEYSSVILTNASLACELLLKAILYSYNIKPHGHNLEDLYNELPANDKKYIKDETFKGIKVKDNFDLCLKEQKDAFINYRYICEVDCYVLNFNFIMGFGRAIYNLCIDKFK